MTESSLPPPVPALASEALRRRRLLRVPAPWRRPLAAAGVAVVAAWVVIAVFAPVIGPDNPLAQNYAILAAPSSAHWFGTDELGRDVLSRVLSGARVTLPLSVLLVILAMIIGAVIGAAAGVAVVAAWVVIAVFAPVIGPDNPLAQNYAILAAPSSAHWFGTDELGRDVLSRVLSGARVTLPLSVLLVILAMIIGAVIGAAAGFLGGWVDNALMRLADLFFAFPGIILAMAVAAALGPQLRNAVIAVVAVSWPSYARLVRSLVLTARTAPYVTASRMLGASGWRVLLTDIRPNISGPVLVLGALDLGNAVLLLSGLSFLGLGAQPPTAEWGAMVAEGTQNFNDWWVGLFPGLAILTVVLAFNFIGDTLRDALDPRTARAVRLS